MACALCRTLPEAAVVADKDRDFWTERFTMEWIEETAYMIWGKKH